MIEVRINWQWFKSLVTMRRRTYDNKLFAIRRGFYLYSRNQNIIHKFFVIWFLEITYYKEK